MELETLRDLYIDELKDLYSAEKQLVKALPKMAKAASSPELKRAFETHLAQTQKQVERLERVFSELDESPRGKKCVGMEGLIEEAKELMEEDAEPEVLDAGLIAKAQHVEHYEMAGYGTVRTYAMQLGEERQARLLQETLDEEGETDKLLTTLAETTVNIEAMLAGDEAEESQARGSQKGSRSEREVSRQAASDGRQGGGQQSRSGRSSGAKRTEREASRR